MFSARILLLNLIAGHPAQSCLDQPLVQADDIVLGITMPLNVNITFLDTNSNTVTSETSPRKPGDNFFNYCGPGEPVEGLQLDDSECDGERTRR